MSQNIPVYAMETSTIIDAPSNLVWEVLIDTHCWSRWGPSVNAVRCRDRFIQSGSKGYVQTAVGIWIPFEITDFVPGKRWSWRVMNIRATGHRVEYLAIKQCRLIFEVPWLAAPYLLICKIAARRIKLIAESN
jgi:uncharacterized protein YndB with AHSA1/START domain